MKRPNRALEPKHRGNLEPNEAHRTLRTHSLGPLCAFLVALAQLMIATSTFAQSTPDFEHDFTRFPLTGRHEYASCESCHVGGQFAGTPILCQSCHAGAGTRAETRPSATHIPIQTDCSPCHTTRFWEPARMDHGVVGENCAGCHNGQMASGKSANHIQSSNRCGDCHGTRRWEGARFDHSTIVTNCFSCHNGSIATPKNPGHIQSSNDCELCHSTQRWVPASGFDHAGITTNCFSCHNGTTATPKNPGHIPSSNDCELCHSTNAWTPAGFDHSGVAPGTCNSCHNGMIATGTPGGHFVSPLSCDACHNTQNWRPADFDHAGTNYPGDHGVSLDCVDCHGGNSSIVTWTSPAYIPDCAACHAQDYKQEVDKHNNLPVSQNTNCAGSGCHSVRDREW